MNYLICKTKYTYISINDKCQLQDEDDWDNQTLSKEPTFTQLRYTISAYADL